MSAAPLVLDFSKLLPGPFATQQLAELGLRVVRVELPHWPDRLRDLPPKKGGLGWAFRACNRGKESLCLDYRKPAGREALFKLLARADALVEGFRPGTMGKLGLGWPALRRRFPRLVYCSLTGYGDEGPASRRAGHDLNFLCGAGYFSVPGTGVPPVQLADLSGAMRAAAAVLAALLERERTGRGRRVSVSMTEAARSWLVLEDGWAEATGREAGESQAWWRGRSHPLYGLYQAADGRRLAVAALEPAFAVDLLRTLGLERLEGAARSDDPGERARLRRALARAFASRPLAHWTRLFAGRDCCVTPALTLAEARAAAPGGPKLRPAPTLGRDNFAVLRRAGLSRVQAARLRKAGVLYSAL
ncbi:MAG: CoA transferase [Elusimicrobia bacterium]|nr:CoA transferase [Elusimicrobiota bacterium]